MASVLEKITQALTELRILREAHEKSCEGWSSDHDKIIALERDNKTVFNKLEGTKCAEHNESIGTLERELDLVSGRIEDVEKKHREEEKDQKSRTWQVWLMVLGTLFGAVVTGVIGAVIARLLGV